VPAAVQTFKQKFSEIDLYFKIDRSHALEKDLLEGLIDLAILSRSPESPHLFGKPYLDEPSVFIAAAKHPLAKRRIVPLELLAKEPFIVPLNSSTRRLIERAYGEKSLTFKVALEVNVFYGSRDPIKDLIANGDGIGYSLVCQAKSFLNAGRLKILNVPELKLKRTIYITVHKNRKNSALVEAFINFLEDYKRQHLQQV